MSKASVASSSLPGRPPKRHRVVLNQYITLRFDDGIECAVTPSVIQTTSVEWGGLGDAEIISDDSVMHRFDVVVHRDIVEDRTDATWQSMRDAYPVKASDSRDEGFRDNADEIWLAHLSIAEIPSHIVEQTSSWADTCDMLGDTLRWGMDIVESIADNVGRPYGQALVEGALLWPQRLGVHPRARGQDIGIKLLAHALWALHRSRSDVAILEAAATTTYFDQVEKIEQTPESFRALCRYYGRLGFRRWFVKQRAHTNGGSIMVLRFGEDGIRAFHESGERLL
ncbi:MAG: hypothetical protein JWL61_5434 [Gemmatimonadetes bacterium]|nr:hypothetical protein [Gemmatimonadota bacterium]